MPMPSQLKFELYQASMEIVGFVAEIRALGVNDKQARLLQQIDDLAMDLKETSDKLEG